MREKKDSRPILICTFSILFDIRGIVRVKTRKTGFVNLRFAACAANSSVVPADDGFVLRILKGRQIIFIYNIFVKVILGIKMSMDVRDRLSYKILIADDNNTPVFIFL